MTRAVHLLREIAVLRLSSLLLHSLLSLLLLHHLMLLLLLLEKMLLLLLQMLLRCLRRSVLLLSTLHPLLFLRDPLRSASSLLRAVLGVLLIRR